MLQLRCTLKVQKQLGLSPNDLSEVKGPDSLLGNWYSNLFMVDRRKTLIFMNERTLLSFVIYGVRKDNSKKISEILLRGIDQLLSMERFDISEINSVFLGYDSVQITKTNSRRVLGNMNDLVELYKHSILYNGGLKHCDLASIIHRINRTPQRNLGWSNSIEVVKQLLRENAQVIT